MLGKKYFLTASKGIFIERLEGGCSNEFNKLSGHLVNITFKESNRGEVIRLHIVDENNFYLLSLFTKSRCAHAFYMLAKNINVLNPITFKIKSVEGRDIFYAVQNGNSIRWFYGTPDSAPLPNDPAERLEFLKQTITADLIPVLQKKQNPYPSHLIYKPFAKGIQGGYFEEFADTYKIPGPISEEESKLYRNANGSDLE